MTDPTTEIPAVCEHELGNGDQRELCGRPATWAGDDGPRCGHHSLGTTQELAQGPDLHGDNLDGHDAARQAIESALTTLPTGTRTVEAKAGHIHAQLVAKGWWMAKPDPGHDLVQIRTDDQHVITVPEGWTFDVRPEDPVVYGPGDQLLDPELSELAEIVARLEGLDPEARERVAGFVTHRYGPTVPVPVDRPSWLDIGARRPLAQGGIIRHQLGKEIT